MGATCGTLKLKPAPPMTAAGSPYALYPMAPPGRNRQGVQGAHVNPLGLFLNPRGHLLTHLHIVSMACSECLPTRLNALPG
jgi:hypothetical protein